MRYLVINADDFGYSRERNEGILKCFEQNIITSTSLLVNGIAALEAARLSLQYEIPTGLHLNITEGAPVGLTPYSTLTGEDGYFLGKHGFRQALKDDIIDKEEVIQEVQSQIDRFKELMGYTPVHTDGHQHIHILPEICSIFASVLKENGILATRVPAEILRDDHIWRSKEQSIFMSRVVQDAKIARSVFNQAGIWSTDSFIGLQTMGTDMKVHSMIQHLYQAFKIRNSTISNTENVEYLDQAITCELMVHPGFVTGEVGGCGGGPDDFSQSAEREHEMSILANQNLLQFYQQKGIELVDFQQCLNKMSV